jgi:hypothetical protein
MQDLLTFTSEIKQINMISTYLHLIKNLDSEFLKKAAPFLTLQ